MLASMFYNRPRAWPEVEPGHRQEASVAQDDARATSRAERKEAPATPDATFGASGRCSRAATGKRDRRANGSPTGTVQHVQSDLVAAHA